LEIWVKIGYNSAYIRDNPEILAYKRGFSRSFSAKDVPFGRDVNKDLTFKAKARTMD